MKCIFTCLLLVINYHCLFAQLIIKGNVKNASEAPVASATVIFLNINSNTQQFLVTDSAGNFTLYNSAGTYLAAVSFTGYVSEKITLTILHDTVIHIVLKQAITQLRDVVVTGNKKAIDNSTEKLVYTISAGITATGSDALNAISQIPGVKVSDNDIAIAGKGAVKIMVNGRIIQLAGNDLVKFLKSMRANQIEKIELIKNPSANYDADGNAGLINIKTKQSKLQGYSGNIQLTGRHWIHHKRVIYGTDNYEATNANVNLNYNSAKWSVYGSLNFDQDHHLEGFETDIYYPKQTWLQTDTGNYRNLNYNMTAGADYKINKKVTAGILYAGGRNIYDGADNVNNPIYNNSGTIDSTLRTYATYYPVALSNAVNIYTAVNFDTVGTKLLINLDYFNYYRTDKSNFESNSFMADGKINPASNTRFFDTNKQDIIIYTVKADVDIPIPFALLSFGGKLSFINTYSNAFYYNKTTQNTLVYNNNLSNEFNYAENTQALYASINKEKNKWKYRAGVRAELTQTKGYSYTLNQKTIHRYLKVFPSVLLSYQVNKDNNVAFTFGRRINRPVFWNLNPFKSLFTAYSYGEGNPFLSPEYNNNFEVSHTLKNNFISALFLNITDNGFTNVTIANANTNLVYTIPLNFIKTYRYGVSENLYLHLFNWLQNNNQVTAYHTSAYSSINTIKNMQAWSLYIATNNTIYFNRNKTFAGALNFWYQFPEVDHNGLSTAYYKVDVGLTILALKKMLNITLNLNDAFRSSALSVTNHVNNLKEKFTNFQINRYVQLSATYRVGKKTNTDTRDTGNDDEKSRAH
jgi:outer membrane receptor protein involved in Fe transport